MRRRTRVLAALIAAAGLVVASPLTAVAYWYVTTQVAVTAHTRTFSIGSLSVAPAAGSSDTFVGWTTTQYFTAPLVNNGATPWAQVALALAPSSGFGAAASASVQVAFTSSNACQNDGTYSGVSAQSALTGSTWSSPTAVAPGATLFACVKLLVADTDTRTSSGNTAPAPTLTLSVTATSAQRNWTAVQAASFTVASTGWASCTSTGATVGLTLPEAVPAGTYTVTRADTGASATATVWAWSPRSLTVSNTISPSAESKETYVTVRNSRGQTVATARLTFRATQFLFFVNRSLSCA